MSVLGGGPSGRDVLRGAVAGQWRRVAGSCALNSGHQAGEALVPVLIGVVVDQAVSDGDGGALARWIAVLAAVYVGLSYSFRYGTRAGERAAEEAAHTLRVGLTRRVLDPHGGAEAGRMPGALANIATEDARRVGAVALALPIGFASLIALAVSAVVLLQVSVPLGLLVLLGTPPLMWAAHLMGRPLERRSSAEQERAAHASGVAADLVAGLRVLKGIGAESAAVERYRHTSQESLRATVRAARAHAWHDGGMLTLTGVFIAVVALVGGRLALAGDISIGQLVAAVGLAHYLIDPLSTLAWVNSELAQGRASATRVAGVLAAPAAVAPASGALPDPVRGRIRLRSVSHGTLRDVNVDIAPGELVGVVTTDPVDAACLLRCLGRGADPEGGTVELDGTPLTGLSPGDIRTAVLVAAHDADLFEGSVLDNVTSAAPGAAPGAAPDAAPDVDAALRAAGADEASLALPQGGDTPVSERGRSLSGGQRQRVALARALAADPPVLVLHDPTTAVDAVTEAGTASGLRALRAGRRTTVMVTTSPALLAVTDRVVFVEGGTVTGTATHAELVHGHEGYRAAVLA